MKNIAFLSHPFHRGGVTGWMIEAAKEFNRIGYNVYFITVDPVLFLSGKLSYLLINLLDNSNISIISRKVSKVFELGLQSYREYTYASLVNKHIPQGIPIVLSDDKSVWGAGRLLSNRYPIIGVLHSDDSVYYNLYNSYCKYLSVTVTVSNRIRDNILKMYGANVNVIPCGINLPEFKHIDKSRDLTLFWAGRIEEAQKRVSDIARIGKELNNRGIDYHWIIAGHGEKNMLKALIRGYEIENKFEFKGWLNQREIYELMDMADILVLTSNYEGMPVVVMESLSKGLGIVSTKVSGVEDLQLDKDAADIIKLYEIGNINDAVDNIISLKEELNIEKRQKASTLARKYYSIETCINSYERIIEPVNSESSNKKSQFYSFGTFILYPISFLIAYLRLIKYNITHSVKHK